MSQASYCEAPPTAPAEDVPGLVCTSLYGAAGAAWLHLAGDLDLATAPRLGRALRRTQQRAWLVVLDLRELAFMDCAGMQVIVDASVRARLDRHRLLVARGPAMVNRVFTLTGASRQVELIDVQPGDGLAARALNPAPAFPLYSATQPAGAVPAPR